MRLADLDPERVGEHGQTALALQRQHRARERGRADHRRIWPVERHTREGLAQDATVEGRVVGHHHPSTQQLGEWRQGRFERRRTVDHRLGDAREALDPAPQRRARAHERAPALVKLAAADQHRADFRQLAAVATEPIGLSVDDHELGSRDRRLEQLHLDGDTPGPGRRAATLASSARCTPAARVDDRELASYDRRAG